MLITIRNINSSLSSYAVAVAMSAVLLISGCDTSSSSDDSSTSSPPATPTNLQANAGDGSIVVSWSAVDGASSYSLYSATVSGVGPDNYSTLAGGSAQESISGTSYTYSDLSNGTTYYFVVVASNSDGNSSASAEVSATPTADTSGSAPDTPANLQASSGDGSVDLTWDAVSGADVYHLYMAEVSGVTASNYANLAGGMAHTNISTNSYSHANLTNGTTYYFVVVAGNSDGNSSISTEVSATPAASTSGSAPDTPTNLQASAGDGSVDLTWDAVSGANVYHLYMAEVSGVTASNYGELTGGMAHTDISTNSYSHSGLTNDTAYYFVVAAGNSEGNSSISTEVSATPTANTGTSSELTLALDLSSSDYSSLMVTEELAEVEEQEAQGMLQNAGSKLSFASGNSLQAQNTSSSSGANFFALDDEDNVHSVFTNSGIYVLYVANDPTGEYAYVALDIDQSADFVKLSQCALYRVELDTNKVFCVEQNYAPADLDSSFTAALEYQGLKPVQFATSDDSESETTILNGIFYLGRPFTVSGGNISWDSASNPLIRKLDIASDGSVSSATTISSDVDTIKSFALLADGLLVYHFSNELSAGLKLYDNGSTNVITDTSDSTDSDYFYSAGDNSDVLMYGKVDDDERIMRFMRSASGGAVNKKELPSEMINGESTVRVISADDGFVYVLTHDEDNEQLNFYQLMPFDETPMFSIDVSGSNLAQALDNKVQLYINHAYYVATDSHPQGSYSDRDVIKIVKKHNGETRTLLNDDAWSQRYDIYKWKKVKDEIHFAGFDNSISKMIYGRVDLTAVENNAADSEVFSVSEISSVLGVSSDILDLEEIRPDAPNKYEAGNPKLEFHVDERNPYAATIEFTKYMNKDDVASGTSIDSSSSATTDHFYVWYYKTLHIVYDQDVSNASTDYLSDGTQVSISLDEEIRDYSDFYLANGMDAEDLSIVYTINPTANQAPVVVISGSNLNLSGYTLEPGEIVSLSAANSYDPDGDTSLSYTWSVSPSSIASISSANSQETTLTVAANASGYLTISLEVCDSQLLCSTDSVVMEVDAEQLSAPSGLSGTADGTSIELQWNGVDSAAKYRIYRDSSLIDESSSTSYTDDDSALEYSTAYSYAVSAVSEADVEGELSSAISVTTDSKPIIAPEADAGSATSVNQGAIVTLDGSGSEDSDGTIIGYSWELISPDVELAITNANQAQASFTAPTVDSSTDYIFRLTVTDNDNASSTATVTITILPADTLASPSNLSASANDDSIDLTWDTVANADGYRIYEGGSLLDSVTSTSYTDASVAAGSSYTYGVSAYDNSSESAQASISITLKPATPTGLSAIASSSKVDLSWNAVNGATSYSLYRDSELIATQSATSYSDTNVVTNSAYSYAVAASNSAGSSELSDAIGVVASTHDTDFQAEYNIATDQVELSYSAQSGASYTLYRSYESDCNVATIVFCDGGTELTISNASASDSLDFAKVQYYQLVSDIGGVQSIFTAVVDGPQELDAAFSDQAFAAVYNPSKNRVEISFAKQDDAQYQLIRSYVSDCDPDDLANCSGGTQLEIFGSAAIDSLDFDENQYYQLLVSVGAAERTYYDEIVGADELSNFAAEQDFSTEYDPSVDKVVIAYNISDSTSYTLYAADEPFATSSCSVDLGVEFCDNHSEWIDGQIPDSESIAWNLTRYYQLDVSVSDSVVASLYSSSNVTSALSLQQPEISADALALEISWPSMKNVASYSLYLAQDSEAVDATVDNWSNLASAVIITDLTSNSYTLTEGFNPYHLALRATNTDGESTGLSTVYQISDIESTSGANGWMQATAEAEWRAREQHTSVAFDNRIWVIGGDTDGNEIWYSSNGAEWTEVTTSGSVWNSRDLHSSLVFDGKIWVIDGNNRYGDVWYSDNAVNWTSVTPGWSGRYSHTSVAFDDKMWMFGGRASDETYSNDIWFSSTGSAWGEVTANANWPGRYSHSSVVFAGQMWVLGGYSGSYLNDIWSSANGTTWDTYTVNGSHWDARYAHTSVVLENKIWLLGGYTSTNSYGEINNGNSSTRYRSDVWVSADGYNWTEAFTGMSTPWGARNYHASIVFDDRIWVIGGYGYISNGDSSASDLIDVWYSFGAITDFTFSELQ